jgi:PHD/YefM family antitoxin component YafN of YafNO toxin-antitoxin module
MFKTEDIRSMSDFVRNARSHAERLRATRRPEVLTHNGAAELVVQNAEAYQELLDRLDELETVAALNEAAAEIDRGEGSSIDEAEARLREKLSIRQRMR